MRISADFENREFSIMVIVCYHRRPRLRFLLGAADSPYGPVEISQRGVDSDCGASQVTPRIARPVLRLAPARTHNRIVSSVVPALDLGLLHLDARRLIHVDRLRVLDAVG